jgi:hypothetical protein
MPEDQPSRPTLSKEERSRIATDAAKRRWANAKEQAAKAAKAASKAAKPKKKGSAPREFSSALKTAEKRLARAIQERAEYAAKYAVVSAEIPSLQQIIQALRNPMGAVPQSYYAGTAVPYAPPTLEQIVGDTPLAYQNPPRPQPVPLPAIPQQLHPANVQAKASKGGGGAIAGMDLEAEENEDQYLGEEPTTGGGAWH